jgi:uncharacterized protein
MIEPQKNFEGLNLTFNTGESCNLACKYCYETDKKNTVLPFDYAKRFIDIILEEDDPLGVIGTKHEWIIRQGVILDFIGGDAFMEVELVEKILRYFIYKSHLINHRWKDRWRASITTNGTLFENPKVRGFIERWRENLAVTVSIDGCPEIHDANRIYRDGSGTISDIKKWWPWFRSLYPDASTKSTLNRDSIPWLYKSLVFMHQEMGLNHINQNFIFENMNLSGQDLELFDNQMQQCVEYVKRNHGELYWSMIDRRLDKSYSYTESVEERPESGWCGSGVMPALGVDGKIYPCFRFLPHTQPLGIDMSVGDVFKGLTRKHRFEEIRKCTREVISNDKCRDCKIESGCAWCIAGAYAESGLPYRPTYICEVQAIQDKWAKEYWRWYNVVVQGI